MKNHWIFFFIIAASVLFGSGIYAASDINYEFYRQSVICSTQIRISDPDALKYLQVRLKWQRISKKDAISIEGTEKQIPWNEPVVESVYELKAENLPLEGLVRIDRIDKKKFRDSLKSTKFSKPADAGIKNLAVKIICNERNSYKAVLRIWDWVYRNIKYDEAVDTLDVKSILKNKKADFAGFSAVFCALARSAGIPAAINYGIKYYNGKFIFFSWVNVFVGKWIFIDVTVPDSTINPTYITFYQGDDSIFSEALNIIDIEILKLEY